MVTLTPGGIEEHRHLAPLVAQVQVELTGSLSDDDTGALDRILRRMLTAAPFSG
jgi:hypothetical protein